MKEITDALHALWGLAPKLSAGAWPQSKAI